MGAVRLTVADLDGLRDFYRDAIGLAEIETVYGGVRMGTGDPSDLPVIELVGDLDAPPRPRGTSGLFHLAILVPSRPDLARALRRVSEAGWRLSGASDHLVSEALYLSDPEGNGIEIYRDRPAEDWPRSGGAVQMATLPLDLEGLLAEVAGESAAPELISAGTRICHVHLNVSDLAATESFYSGGLGLDVTVRDYPGALFLSAGGSHHHVGANTWAGEGAPPPPPGARGLERYELLLPSETALTQAEQELEVAGVEVNRDDQGLHSLDPDGNGLLLRTT